MVCSASPLLSNLCMAGSTEGLIKTEGICVISLGPQESSELLCWGFGSSLQLWHFWGL